MPEGEVLPGILPMDVEVFRVFKDRGIAVRGAEQQKRPGWPLATAPGSAAPPGVVRQVLLGRFWLAPQSTLVPASVWSIVVSFSTATVALRLRRATCGRVADFTGGRPAFALRFFVARVFFVAMGHLAGEYRKDQVPEDTRLPAGALECVPAILVSTPPLA
jgi:hypothetical protein